MALVTFPGEAVRPVRIIVANHRDGFRAVYHPDRVRRKAHTPPADQYVRALRDLALFIVECAEFGHDGSTLVVELLLPVGVKVPHAAARDAGRAAIRDLQRGPVTDCALGLASYLEAASGTPASAVREALCAVCAAFDERGQCQSDREERTQRGFLQIMRYLERRIFEGFGAHSRTFARMVSDDMVPTGHGRQGGLRREHVVPCALLREKAQELLKSGASLEQAARWIRPYVSIVYVQEQESSRLDAIAGLKTGMPEPWSWQDGCIYERLHAAHIGFDLVDGSACCSGHAVHRLQ